MKKVIKDFVKFVEDVAEDGIILNSPEFETLKNLSEQKIVVTDEMVVAGCIKMGLDYGVQHWYDDMKSALEAVFDMVNKESANNAQCKKKICDGCKGDLTKNVCECEWLEEKPLDDGWIEWDDGENIRVPSPCELQIKCENETVYIIKCSHHYNFKGLSTWRGDIIAYRIIPEPENSSAKAELDLLNIAYENGLTPDTLYQVKESVSADKPTPKQTLKEYFKAKGLVLNHGMEMLGEYLEERLK